MLNSVQFQRINGVKVQFLIKNEKQIITNLQLLTKQMKLSEQIHQRPLKPPLWISGISYENLNRLRAAFFQKLTGKNIETNT